MPQDLQLINAIYFYAPHLYPYPTGQTQRCLRQLSGSNRSEFEGRCFSAPDVTALFIFGCEPRWPDRRCHHSTAAPYIYELDSLCSIYTLTFKIPEETPPHTTTTTIRQRQSLQSRTKTRWEGQMDG